MNYNEEDIKKEINSKIIGKNLIFFEEISSTNDYLKLNSQNFEEGTVVVAKSQTKGRGRRGNTWENSKNESIFMSILLKPNVKPQSLLRISLVCSLSVIKALNYTNLPLEIKWPNDIVVNGKKLCGILTECVISENNEVDLILGIGMNVRSVSFSKDLQEKATSLILENIETTIPIVISQILKCIEQNYYTYLQYGFKFFIDEYRKYCCNIDKEVVIINGDSKEYGRVIDINADGTLLFKDVNGNVKNIFSNEVSVRGINGYV